MVGKYCGSNHPEILRNQGQSGIRNGWVSGKGMAKDMALTLREIGFES